MAGVEGEWEGTDNEYGISSLDDENILKLTVVITENFYEYSKNHWTAHFKWVNHTINNLNNAVIENRIN